MCVGMYGCVCVFAGVGEVKWRGVLSCAVVLGEGGGYRVGVGEKKERQKAGMTQMVIYCDHEKYDINNYSNNKNKDNKYRTKITNTNKT